MVDGNGLLHPRGKCSFTGRNGLSISSEHYSKEKFSHLLYGLMVK